MPRKKVSPSWKGDERDVAEIFTESLDTVNEYGHTCRRIPLSGSNNIRTDGTPHRGDISLPDEYDFLTEVKRRESFYHQRLLDAALADAKKHGLSTAILITKEKGQRGFTAVLPLDVLAKLLSSAEARSKLKLPKSIEEHLIEDLGLSEEELDD